MENKTTVVEVQEEAKNEVATMSAGDRGFMEQQDLGSYYSIVPETREEKVMVYNAINNPDARLSDQINKTIKVKDVLIEVIELVSEETGELNKVPRIVVLDDKGKSYQAVSVGIFSALKRIINLFGEPTWEEPVVMEVKQITSKDRKMLTLELK